ncbi:PDC sensor domain-containing protein [Paenibacillus amylolyticus]|nr:PDC sensor domain-containing protein [Paenibacillus amylolyticus]WFR62011.1 PDC sensor domain-containing protein [Paenibacillus amylolyticus]
MIAQLKRFKLRRKIKNIKRNKKIKNIKKISLTALLSGLVTISVLMTLTLMFISSYTSQKQSLIDNTLSLNYASAVQMSQAMDSLFNSMQGSLKFAAQYFSDMDNSNTKELNSTLDLVRNSSNFFNSVALVNKQGVVISTSPYSQASVGHHVSSDAAKEAVKSRASYISEAYQTPRTKRRIVFVSEPIFDSAGMYQGTLGGNIFCRKIIY